MDERITWVAKSIFILLAILLINFPIVFAICRDISSEFVTTMIVILSISALYGFCTWGSNHFIHAIAIGVLAGNIITLLTWVASFSQQSFHILLSARLGTFFHLGILLPAVFQFYLSLKYDKTKYAILHTALSMFFIALLSSYIIFQMLQWELNQSLLYDFLNLVFGFTVGLLSFSLVHLVLAKNLLVFEQLSRYLKVMVKPVLAFFMGYMLILLIFAGLYTIAYFVNHDVFNHLKNNRFGELLYYSFSIITSLGFSIVEPEKPITLFLTTLENFLGLAWMTVVLAATLAHLQRPFSRISKQLDRHEK